eukprot:scaffold931_cov200-Alexandrium_tamarense.AAC.9
MESGWMTLLLIPLLLSAHGRRMSWVRLVVVMGNPQRRDLKRRVQNLEFLSFLVSPPLTAVTSHGVFHRDHVKLVTGIPTSCQV